ncbi:MAG: hypothetical protein ACTSSG_14580 [Candidatus Heimdallarchaeaceae archaeon]
MVELYLFKCLECGLEFKLGRGKGGRNIYPSTMFFCEKCEKLSTQHKCETCGKYLKRIIYPTKRIELDLCETEGEIRVKCPNCMSDHTLLVPLDKWVVDYQVW